MRTSTTAAWSAAAALATIAVGQSCVTSGVHIIVARGTNEPAGEGMESTVIDQILTQIPGSDASAVDYPANYQIPYSPNQGAINMLRQANDYAQDCPDSQMVLMGYSQGAQVCANTVSGGGVETLGTAPATADNAPLSSSVMDKVASIIVFGDVNFIANEPYTLDGCFTSSNIPRQGDSAELWNSYGYKMQSWCAYEDLVCCGNGTLVSAHTGYFTQDTANTVADFVEDKLSSARAGTLPSATIMVTSSATETASSTVVKSTTKTSATSESTPSSAASYLSLSPQIAGIAVVLPWVLLHL